MKRGLVINQIHTPDVERAARLASPQANDRRPMRHRVSAHGASPPVVLPATGQRNNSCIAPRPPTESAQPRLSPSEHHPAKATRRELVIVPTQQPPRRPAQPPTA